MLFSKRGEWILLMALLPIWGCTTSSYRVLYQSDSAAELSVTPDRVVLECEDLYDADTKGLYGFMMHVLGDRNTVLTLVQGNTLDKEGCEERLRSIGRILYEGGSIYIAGRGDMRKVEKESLREFRFPQLGVFKEDGRILGFVAISNEHGLCYAAYGGLGDKPCPPEPFPLWPAQGTLQH